MPFRQRMKSDNLAAALAANCEICAPFHLRPIQFPGLAQDTRPPPVRLKPEPQDKPQAPLVPGLACSTGVLPVMGIAYFLMLRSWNGAVGDLADFQVRSWRGASRLWTAHGARKSFGCVKPPIPGVVLLDKQGNAYAPVLCTLRVSLPF